MTKYLEYNNKPYCTLNTTRAKNISKLKFSLLLDQPVANVKIVNESLQFLLEAVHFLMSIDRFRTLENWTPQPFLRKTIRIYAEIQ